MYAYIGPLAQFCKIPNPEIVDFGRFMTPKEYGEALQRTGRQVWQKSK